MPIASGLDPQIENGTGLAIFPKIYRYPFRLRPDDDSLILDQAESVEQIDAITTVIRLRSDVRFHDVPPVNGRPVRAEDVVRSIQRYRDNPLVTSHTWHTSVLDIAEATDDRTVRVVTRRPYAWTLHELSGVAAGAIIPVEMLAADLTSVAIGSGPYQLDRFSPEFVRLRRSGGYVGDEPYVQAREWQIVADDAARDAAFASQAADLAPVNDHATATRLAGNSGRVQVDTTPALAYLSLGLRTDRPPFADPRAREAVDYALDRAAMIRGIAPQDGAVLGPVNQHLAGGFWSVPEPDVAAASRATEPLDARLAAARALLDASGATGARLRLQVTKEPQLLDVATLVRDNLQRVGLVVDLETLDLLTWFVNFRRADFDATLIAQPPYEWPDTPTRLYHSRGPDGAGSPFAFADAGIDALVERSSEELDRAARRALLLEAQRQMITARPMLQLLTNAAHTVAWGYVQGRRPELQGSAAAYDTGQWLDASGFAPTRPRDS
ncbi:MAG: ABC transporter substrate-binding protein [Chloroflexi bacterium]|nr:ABC transporter substrate-binding protein [Chloroflexota bacterium]